MAFLCQIPFDKTIFCINVLVKFRKSAFRNLRNAKMKTIVKSEEE